MDKLESLSNTISQITLYDIKSVYNQAKNMVLNVSETEAKVREATNDDPWGASSTLMQEIAQGTFNFHQFNEIMPAIYSRFMEKEARQWRQIYKALQLLEYLIKHGSERVVDDARAHISTLKMLRNFHYIDEKGKDEGINVRNRARELVELLSDVEKIRIERRKAKSNRHKYVGTGNEGFGLSGGSRYGGFGSETLSSNNDFYRSGIGSSTSGFRDDARRGGFEEYDAGDDEDVQKKPTPFNNSASRNKATPPEPAPASAAPAPAPAVDLLGGLDDILSSVNTTTATVTSNNKALPAVNSKQSVGLDDDDFDDFQVAPVQVPTLSGGAFAPTTVHAAPSAPTKPNLMDLLNARPSQFSVPRTGFTQSPVQQPSLFGSVGSGFGTSTHRPSASISSISTPLQPTQTGNSISKTPTNTGPLRPTSVASSSRPAVTQSKPSSNFDDLWSMSLGTTSKPTTPVGGAKSIKDLEKEKSQAALWGSRSNAKPPMAVMGNVNTFGSFGGAGFGAGTQSNDTDDLLL